MVIKNVFSKKVLSFVIAMLSEEKQHIFEWCRGKGQSISVLIAKKQ